MLALIPAKKQRVRKTALTEIYIGDKLPAEQTVELYKAFCGIDVDSPADVSRTALGSAMLAYAVEAYNKNAE